MAENHIGRILLKFIPVPGHRSTIYLTPPPCHPAKGHFLWKFFPSSQKSPHLLRLILIRLLHLALLPIFVTSCVMTVHEAQKAPAPLKKQAIKWPAWKPADPSPDKSVQNEFFPQFIKTGRATVITYGERPDGREHFLVMSRREEKQPEGIGAIRQCFLPQSSFAGPCPLQVHTNTLFADDRKWFYPAYFFRSTFFDLYPSLTPKAKGLLFYHTSIMLLSVAEKQVIGRFRKKGWNVVVALPPDSLYRTPLPVLRSSRGTIDEAADLVANDMDRHYLEQASSTRVALEYLKRTRPEWLNGPKVLMGTSAGTFAMPAEILMNPDWDAVIFVSGGTNLLSLYESGSAGLFKNTLTWAHQFRKQPPTGVNRMFTDEEYHRIYRRAAKRTRFHSGALASGIRDYPILMIAGTVDRIMPDEQALELHRLLGQPERWTAPLGHHLIAVQLIIEVGRINRWLDQVISDTSGE